MPNSIPVEIGGKVRYLRFTSKAAQRAVNELQAHMQVGWLPQKLQIGAAANMIEKNLDRDAIVIFLTHGLEEKISEEKLWKWLDDHCEQHGSQESLILIAKPIGDALIEAKLVREDPSERPAATEGARPTAPAAAPRDE